MHEDEEVQRRRK